jgi:hypothetical protein
VKDKHPSDPRTHKYDPREVRIMEQRRESKSETIKWEKEKEEEEEEKEEKGKKDEEEEKPNEKK